MYVGRPWRGLGANLLGVGALAGFVGLFVWLEFFPLLPLLVLAAGWIVFAAMLSAEVRARADELDEAYEPRGYNHWTIYAAVALVTWALPLAATAAVSLRSVWGLATVDDRAMYPTLQAGETVLVDRSAYRSAPPERGELVAVRFPGESTRVLRVVAAGGDSIQWAAGTIYVDGTRLPQVPLDSRLASATLPEGASYELWVERNAETTYVVSLRPAHRDEPEFESTELDDDKVYLLADNRSHPEGDDGEETGPGDSREIGPVRRGAISGEPLYVAWSNSPSTGEIRWSRIGVELR